MRLDGAGREADSGFSLLEVVVAMAVFAVFCTTSAGLTVRLAGSAGDTLRRTVATNLATEAVQAVRGMSALEIPDGKVVRATRVGGVDYTLTQTASFLAGTAGQTVCTGTGDISYRLVTVEVTWADARRASAPVRLQTLRSQGSSVDGSTGVLAVRVVGADGGPSAGVTLTLSPGGRTAVSDATGCAVLPRLAPATYTVAAEAPGWTGPLNARRATAGNLAVAVDQVRRGTLLYDTTRAASVVLQHPAADPVVPAGLAVRLGSTYVPEKGYPTCSPADADTTAAGCVDLPSGATPGPVTGPVTGLAAGLFPETYTFAAGSCLETARSQATVDLRPVTDLRPTVSIPVGGAAVTVRTVLGAAASSGRVLTFRHSAQATGCTSGETLTTTTSDAGGTVLLPYGTWTVSTPASPLTPTVAVSTTFTVSPSARTATPTLTVLL